MLLNDIIKDPIQALSYMERLVNNGSKSPFTFVNTVSHDTNPIFVEKFCLDEGTKCNSTIITLGKIPENILKLKSVNSIFLHPDWRLSDKNFLIQQSNAIVEPTASQRTVKVESIPYYIKLAHPFILGRITRELESKHILSSIDITNILFNTYLNAPQKFAFFPEIGGQILKTEAEEIGYVVRSSTPVGRNADKIKYLIPGFSLFGKDKKSDNDEILIHQILCNKQDKKGYIINEIILPLIDCYFFYVFSEGLQFELHAQNFLIGFNENFDVVSFVIRDLESTDKDITIRSILGKDTNLLSSPFKCISSDQYNYKIKHSFMYDHKLCEYFIDQLILAVSNDLRLSVNDIRNEVKNNVLLKYGRKLDNFFPEDNCWYKFEDKIIDRTKLERPYQAIPNPYFR